MENSGIVTKVSGENIEVLSYRYAACSQNCEGCSSSCAESKPHTFVVKNTIGAKVGDKVSIRTSSDSVLKYISLVYGLPLVFFLVGIIISYYVIKIPNQVYCFLIGLVFTAFAYVLVKNIDKKTGNLSDSIILEKA